MHFVYKNRKYFKIWIIFSDAAALYKGYFQCYVFIGTAFYEYNCASKA